MNYPAFTNDSVTMMYEGIRGALAADDALSGLGEEPRFRVRETPDWKLHGAELETEMLNRGSLMSSTGQRIKQFCRPRNDHVAQVGAREPADSTLAGFAVVGRGDPLMLVLLFKATLFGRA
jgi:hypothetical protein